VRRNPSLKSACSATALFPLWLLALPAEAQPAPPAPDRAAMEALRTAQAAMPDTPGTGAFPALKEEVSSLPDHVVYRPADLGKLGSKKLGLYLFGNGGCSNDGASSRLHLLEIASHGYLAIALGRIRTGPGATVPPEPARSQQPEVRGAPRSLPPPATDSKGLITALEWALGQNVDPASPYHDRIDPTAVAVSGFSCGGLQALQVAADPRVKTLVVMNSGIFNDGSPIPGISVSKTLLGTLHAPTLYLLGSETDIAYKNGMDDFARIDHIPVFVGNVVGAGHGGTYWEPNGGKAAAAVVAWLDWQLRGDENGKRKFVGESCGLCVDAAWKIDKKRID
jgi:dienelactone hydrolase